MVGEKRTRVLAALGLNSRDTEFKSHSDIISRHLYLKLFCYLEQILSLDGVLSYREPHFWRHSSDTLVGSIHVLVAPSVNEQRIIQMVSTLLSSSNQIKWTLKGGREVMEATKIEKCLVAMDPFK